MHPQQPAPVWVADGTTEYTVQVFVDNTGLGGQPTDAVQWRFLNAAGFNFTDATLPINGDFFAGIAMLDDWVLPPTQLSTRQVLERSTDPVDHQGNVGSYVFTVLPGMSPGQYTFDLTDTLLLDDSFPHGIPQPHTVSNDPVWVAPINPADFQYPPEISRDGFINEADFQFFATHMNGPGNASPADIDGDGSADMEDLARFQACFTGTNPVSEPTCGG
jgi:hypothetical protein